MTEAKTSQQDSQSDAVLSMRRIVFVALALAISLELLSKFLFKFELIGGPVADLITVVAIAVLGLSGLYALHNTYRQRRISLIFLGGILLLTVSQLAEISGDLSLFGESEKLLFGRPLYKMTMDATLVPGLGLLVAAFYLSIFQSLRTNHLLERERAAAVREMAERQQAQEKLRSSQKRLRTIFEGLQDALFVHDLDGRIIDCNRAACEAMGYTREELLSMRTVDLDAPEFAAGFRERLARQLKNGSYHCEGELITKDGRHITVDIHTTRIEYQGLPAILALNRDISERVKMEQHRRQLEEKIRHTQKLESLEMLAGGVAHDFNNLLMGVLGNASLALQQLPPDSPACDSVRQVELAAQRAADLAKQMLAYSGRGALAIERLNLGTLVEEMSHLLSSSITKNASITLELAEELPAIDGDPTQIRQIVMNLITNASDAIADKTGVIEISTGTVRVPHGARLTSYFNDDLPAGTYAYVQVSDTGHGMDSETLSRIFDPFFTTKFPGRGLGLSVVVGIVKGHRGAVQVDSTPGKGTRFRILFPSVAESAPSKSTPPASKWESCEDATILVVDDEDVVLTATRKILEFAGFTVLTARDGEECIDLLQARPHDVALVLLDLTMPRLSGEDTYRAIRKIRPDVPILLSSGYTPPEPSHYPDGDGPAGFIQKPYLASDLVNLILKTLARGQSAHAK